MQLRKFCIVLLIAAIFTGIVVDAVTAKGGGRGGGFSGGGKSYSSSFKSSGSSYKAGSSSPVAYKSGTSAKSSYSKTIKTGTTKSYQGKTVIYKNNGWYDSITGAFIGASLAGMVFDDSDYEDIPQETPGFTAFGVLIALGMLFAVLRR